MLFGPRVVLIDNGSMSAQSYRAAVSNIDVSNDTMINPMHAARGLLIYLATMMRSFSTYGVPLIVNDRYPTRKLNQFAGYKAKRFERYKKVHFDEASGHTEVPQGEEKSLHQQFREILLPILNSLPLVQAHSAGEEADDSIRTAAGQIGRTSGTKLSVFTKDTDMFQMHGMDRILSILYKPGGGVPMVQVTSQMILEKYPVKRPSQIPLYKALLGDAGDSIPCIGGRLRKDWVCTDLIGNFETVQELYDAYWGETIEYQHNWSDNAFDAISAWLGDQTDPTAPRGQAFVNEDLARLKDDCNIVYTYTGGDYQAFSESYSKYASLLSESVDPIQVWNYFAHASQQIAKIFEKDGLYLSNPNAVNLI